MMVMKRLSALQTRRQPRLEKNVSQTLLIKVKLR